MNIDSAFERLGLAEESNSNATSEGSSVTIIAAPASEATLNINTEEIKFRLCEGPSDIPDIVKLLDDELSEPYNDYTYLYFLNGWPHLCFIAHYNGQAVGIVLSKQETHREKTNRGYIAMLSTSKKFRGRGIATHLIQLSVAEMLRRDCDEVALETEFDNAEALGFYRRLGFIKQKRLFRYYFNGKDGIRLILPTRHIVRRLKGRNASNISDVQASRAAMQAS